MYIHPQLQYPGNLSDRQPDRQPGQQDNQQSNREQVQETTGNRQAASQTSTTNVEALRESPTHSSVQPPAAGSPPAVEPPLSEAHDREVPGQESDKDSSGLISRVYQAIRQATSVSEVMRVSGAVTMLFSMVLFLYDGVSIDNDIERYLSILGLTSATALAGFALSWWLNEQRGARMFFGLALASIPANFAVIGAMLYAIVPLDKLAVSYPAALQWQAPTLQSLLLAGVGTMIVLLPVTWIGMSIMARPARGWLTPLMLAASAVLLIPVRTPEIVLIIATVAALGIYLAIRRASTDATALKTPAGRLTLALLFVPLVTTVVRSLWLYPGGTEVVLMLSVMGYALIRFAAMRVTGKGLLHHLLAFGNLALLIPASLSIAMLASPHLPEVLTMMIINLMTGAAGYDIATRARTPALKSLIDLIIALAMSMMLAGSALLMTGSALTTMVTTVGALLLMVMGVLTRNRIRFLAGGSTLIALMFIHGLGLGYVYDLALQTGWWGIALAGGTLIIAASVVDRHGAQLLLRWFKFTNRQQSGA